MIDFSPSSIRIFFIILLGAIWFYLIIESIAINSTNDDD